MAFHYPQGIVGWSVFAFGLLLIAYRVHGIDAPRTWIEWVERRFTYSIALRFVGGIILILASIPLYLASPSGFLGYLFLAGMILLALVGLSLLALQNHARSLVFATAESSDTMIRIASIILTLVGLGYLIAPFFL